MDEPGSAGLNVPSRVVKGRGRQAAQEVLVGLHATAFPNAFYDKVEV